MTVAQLEHADTFCDPLPAQDTLERMEELFTRRRRELVLVKNRRIQLAGFDERFSDEGWQMSQGRIRLTNELNQAELRMAEIEFEIVEVARLIVAEADNLEMINLAASERATE